MSGRIGVELKSGRKEGHTELQYGQRIKSE